MVTNARFEPAFHRWLEAGEHALELELICDGSTAPENRLGAIRDLALALERVPAGEPVFVTASDNLYTADFHGLVARFEETGSPVVAAVREDDTAKLRRSGVATISGDDGRMVAFVEKPDEPPSPYAAPPLYLYPPDIRRDIAAFLQDPGLDHDAPGNLVPFLLKRRPVYAVVLEGRRYDIGSLEVYEEVSRVFGAEP
jgi:glucose-1-phosphate thymidylyltransferase